MRILNAEGETVDAQAICFTHTGDCFDQFLEKAKSEHPDWFGDEQKK